MSTKLSKVIENADEDPLHGGDEDKYDGPNDHKKIEAHGVRGMKSTPWRKTFKNRKALNQWVDANDSVEVHATRNVEEAMSARQKLLKVIEGDGQPGFDLPPEGQGGGTQPISADEVKAAFEQCGVYFVNRSHGLATTTTIPLETLLKAATQLVQLHAQVPSGPPPGHADDNDDICPTCRRSSVNSDEEF